MPPVRRLLWMVLVALLLAAAGPSLAAACECDSAHVRHQKNVVLVYPTGTDDTANLRCVLAAAIRGQVIELQAGQFYSDQLWATDFVGTLRGKGKALTTLSNHGVLEPAQEWDVLFRPPSEDNLWPSFLTFVGGDFTVADLAIRMKGPQLATSYWFLGWVQNHNNIMGEIVITGEQANAAIRRVHIEGATIDAGMAAPYGDVVSIFYQPILGGYATPISGRFEVTDCTFKHVQEAFNAGATTHAQVRWERNAVEDANAAVELFELQHTVVQVTGNSLQSGLYEPVAIWGGPVFSTGGLDHAVVSIEGNVFTGPEHLAGLLVLQLADETLNLFAAGNRFVGTQGIVLGPESHGLIIKADGATVTDLSGANKILK